VSLVVLLDAGPLSLVTNPKGSDESRRCKAWLAELVAAGVQIMVPEGADYEVRRELIRAGRRGGLERLDNLARNAVFLPVTTAVWRSAAELWAQARNEGDSPPISAFEKNHPICSCLSLKPGHFAVRSVTFFPLISGLGGVLQPSSRVPSSL